MAPTPTPTVFVFPLAEEATKVVPSLEGALGIYFDRSFWGAVQNGIGDEPRVKDAARAAVFEILNAQIDRLGLPGRLYPQGAKQTAMRYFVKRTPEKVRAVAKKHGWTVVFPLEEPAGAVRAEPKKSPAAVAPKKTAAAKAKAIPKALLDRVAKIGALARASGAKLASTGATREDLAALEERVGVELPLEVCAFYLAHDGGPKNQPAFGDRWLMSLDRIAAAYSTFEERAEDDEDDDENLEADRGVRAESWNAKWIPVTHDAGGNHDMLDLAPAKGGKTGQIISVYHDDDRRFLEAPDLLTWLEKKLGKGSAADKAKPKASPSAKTKPKK